MRKKLLPVFALALCAALLTACAPDAGDASGTSAQETVSLSQSTGEMDFSFTDRDISGEYGEAEALSTSTITAAGTYVLSGAITDRMITVAAGENDKVQLVLDNAAIHNSTGPAIYIRSADKVFITLKDGTVNTLSDGSGYSYTDGDTTVDSAIFSRSDLTINGSGTLTLTANTKHGIVSKDDLTVAGGTLTVSAPNVGLCGKDCVKIRAAVLNITAGSDGIRSDNAEDAARGYVYMEDGTVSITAGNDGIQAQTALKLGSPSLTIRAGSSSAASLGGSSESFKGLKAGTDILICGGTYQIDSQDDSIHCNNSICITDGVFTLASGDDGIHADTDLSVSGGRIAVTKSYEGLEASRILISGGRIDVTAADDGLNAAGGNDSSAMLGRPGMGMFSSSTGEIRISGGYLLVSAAGDGIDSNSTLHISGGTVLVSGPTGGGNGILDYGSSGTLSGGTLVALGSSDMVQSVAAEGGRGVLACTFPTQSAGTAFLLCDPEGNVVVSFTPEKAYQCAIVSAPGMVSGSSYSVAVGGEAVGADENGYAKSTTYTGGTVLGTLEASSGASGGGMGGGGMGGGGMGGGRPGGRH